jgi:hypothetical protein
MRHFLLLLLAAGSLLPSPIGCGKRPVDQPPSNSVPREASWMAYDLAPFGSPPRLVTAGKFDKIRSGMTLGQIVEALWVGRLPAGPYYSGCGIIHWMCEDGRELSVSPVTYSKEEVIRVDGGNGGIGRMWMTTQNGQLAVETPRKKAV